MNPFLFRQAAYLCRVRWYVFGLTAALIVLGMKLGISPPLLRIYTLLVSIGVLVNIISCLAYRRARNHPTRFFSPSSSFLRWWTYFHTLVDFILIIASIHFTSGTQSPALYLLIVYVAGMALTYGETAPVFIFTGISAGLFNGLLILYARGTLSPAPVFHYTVAAIQSPQYHKSLLMNMVALDSLLFIVAGLVLNQTNQLRLLWESAEQHSVFLDQLNDLSHQSMRHEDLPTIVREISERLRQILGGDVVYTVLWEEKGERTVPIVTYGIHEQMNQRMVSPSDQTRFRDGCYRLIAPSREQARPRWIDIKSTDLPEPIRAFFASFETLLVLPINLPGADDLLGTITLAYYKKPSNSAAHLNRAYKATTTIAPLLARAIDHHQTTQHLSLLQELANDVTDLTRSLQVHALATNAIESATRLFKTQGSILLPYPSPPNTAVLQKWYATGLPSEYVQQLLTHAPEFFRPFFTLEERFCQIPDVTDDANILSPELKEATLAAGTRAMALFLVTSPRNPVGVLGLFWNDPHILSPREIAIGQLFSASAGAALYNAYLYHLLRKEAHTDALTRLPNRRAVNEALERELRRAQRYHHPFSVVMLDLNNFKAINDRFGHQRGDLVLQKLADLLQQHLRETDFVGRFGGDEFLIIFPETDKHSAQQAMEIVYHAITSHRFNFLPHDFRLQMSFGIAAYPDDGENTSILVDTADLRLYHHKPVK